MPDTLTLSASAVAVLRFRVRGYKMPVTPQRQPAFEELAAAGIMKPDGSDYRFTAEAIPRRREILAEAEQALREQEPCLPDRIDLSDGARRLLGTFLEGNIPDADDATRPLYLELARAGIIAAVGTFAKGDNVVFRWTYRGWQRRFEFAEPTAPSPGKSASPRP